MKKLVSRTSALRKRVKELKARGTGKFQRRRELLLEDAKTKQLIAKLSKKEQEAIHEIFGPDGLAITNGIWALGGLNSKASVPILKHFLKSSNRHIRVATLMNLSFLGEPKLLPTMAKLMYDKDIFVSCKAIELFGGLAQSEPLALKLLQKRSENSMDLQEIKSFKKALSVYTGDGIEHELYGGAHEINGFNDKKRKVVRDWQLKDGSGTVLLGGGLYGKATVRVIGKYGLDAWKKAIKLGIPVEPILKKNGRFRIAKNKDGSYRVSTGVLKGQSVYAFFRNKKHKQFHWEVSRQGREIIRQLDLNGIVHGHLHSGNMVVVMKQGKPKVYLIDFDQARAPNLLTQGKS
jgi:hypothetical protein